MILNIVEVKVCPTFLLLIIKIYIFKFDMKMYLKRLQYDKIQVVPSQTNLNSVFTLWLLAC